MIESTYLNNLANYTNENITKIVINDGEYEIDTFELKLVADGTVTMNYIIPNGSVETVTNIKTVDDDDNVVSDNTVNIPITAHQLMVQTLEIKEVTS